MSKLLYARVASGNVLARFFLSDSSSSTGAGLTGLTNASAGLRIGVIRELSATVTSYTVAGSLIDTITTLGTYAAPTATHVRFKEIDATALPGIYEVQFEQATFGTGDASRFVIGEIFGATNLAPCPFEIQLAGLDIQDGVRAGLTALPNAAAEAAGGLYTRGAGAGQIKQTNNGEIDANAAHINNIATTSVTTVSDHVGTVGASTAQTGDNFPRLGAPAGASMAADVAAVKTDSAAVKTQTDKLAFSVTNQIDANVLDWKGVAAPAMTGDAFARLGAPVGLSTAADIAGVLAKTPDAAHYTNARGDNLANLDSAVSGVKSDTGTILTDVNTGAGAIYTRLGAPAGASLAADVAAVQAKTTNLPASPAAIGSAMTLTTGERTSIADAQLDRDLSVGADSGSSTVRTPRQALRALRNKVDTVAGTVYKEDDATASWAFAVTTDPTAQPITILNPAGGS